MTTEVATETIIKETSELEINPISKNPLENRPEEKTEKVSTEDEKSEISTPLDTDTESTPVNVFDNLFQKEDDKQNSSDSDEESYFSYSDRKSVV